MNTIKVYLPYHINSCNTILLTNCFINRLNELNIPNQLVRDINELIPKDIVVHRLDSDIYNGSLANTEKCSQELYKLISDIENIGCICYPSAELMKYYENKVQLYKLFTDKGVKIPDSFLVSNINQYYEIREKLLKYLPVIIKACFSCSSNNIQQASNINELDNIIKNYFASNNSVILIQKKIHFTREARLTYIGENIYHSYYRIKSSADKVSGATNYGSSISFTINTDRLKSFIKNFIDKTKFYIGGIDIVWENDDLNSDPYVLEVSPIYDINPPPIGEYETLPYSMFKKSGYYESEKQKIYQFAANNILDYIIDINSRPLLLVDIDCTLSDSEPRIKKWANGEAYKNYENMILDQPIENSVTILDKLAEIYKIVIITARRGFKDGLRSTKDWLYKHNYTFHQLILVNELREKTLFYQDKNTDLLIDDFTTNHHINTIDDEGNLIYYRQNGYQFIKFDKNKLNWLQLKKMLIPNKNIEIVDNINNKYLEYYRNNLQDKKVLIAGLNYNKKQWDNNLDRYVQYYKRKYSFKKDNHLLKLGEISSSLVFIDETIKLDYKHSYCIKYADQIDHFSNDKTFDTIILRYVLTNDEKIYLLNSLVKCLTENGQIMIEVINDGFNHLEVQTIEYICKINNLDNKLIKIDYDSFNLELNVVKKLH